ncbi:MAG: glycoside hydrolase family 15 protein [Pyrinomonadaceae bacterium]
MTDLVSKLIKTSFCALILAAFVVANDAPSGPGIDAQWASAGKQGVGTSESLASKVWYTIEGGALTDIYYPNVTVNNVSQMYFVVEDTSLGTITTERDETVANSVRAGIDDDGKPIVNSLAFTQINAAKDGAWTIEKRYVTDANQNTVLFLVDFKPKKEGLKLYLFFDPSIANSGMGDTGWNSANGFAAADGDVVSYLGCGGCSFEDRTNGFLGVNDGLSQLRKGGVTERYSRAANGNIVQFARIVTDGRVVAKRFEIALGFGSNEAEAKKAATETIAKGFEAISDNYLSGWKRYLASIPSVDAEFLDQYRMAAMTLKAHEDKTFRGANIASLTVPWGGAANANENNVGGYHLVWSRDLYQVFTAYLALGDREAATRALEFLLKVQQKPDGSFPQNSWLDGKPFWGSLQLDEVAYPLIMAHKIGMDDSETYKKHLRPAANFIVENGPMTPQERWEEESGYSPSTIAAEIAGLVCAAEIAEKNGDGAAARKFRSTADFWNRNLERWTATSVGPFGNGNYYLRITSEGHPNERNPIELNNGAGVFPEDQVVDAGFLELVRLGIRRADDPLILKSLKVIDEKIRVNTPNGESFYRYNGDGYGEMDDGRRWNWDGKYTGKGRLWALLAGERGQFELERSLLGGDGADGHRASAKARLRAMKAFANDGLMIPEQIWDREAVPENPSIFSPRLSFGEGTGSATPLAWSMAQFIRLATNLKAGKNLDKPEIVSKRYADSKTQQEPRGFSTNGTEYTCADEFAYQSDPGKFVSNPFVSGDHAVFVYKGAAKDVRFTGDVTGWSQEGIKLISIPGTDMRCAGFQVSPAARFEYQFIEDGKWKLDPLNPLKSNNGVGGENSVLEMPRYKESEYTAEYKGLPGPGISELEIESKEFGVRKVKIYVPSEYFKRGVAPELPVLYLFDGTDYIKRGKAIDVLENLIEKRKVEPFMIVFTDPVDRTGEYKLNDKYADYIATEVVPAVEKKYFSTIKTGRKNRAVMGASFGGLASLWTSLRHPDVFGRVGGQSTSFWANDEQVVGALENLQKSDNDFVFYFDDGLFEGVEDTRSAVKLLREKGFSVSYIERDTGHNAPAWRDRLEHAFIKLWE